MMLQLNCIITYRDIVSRPTVAELLKHEYVNVSAASDGAGMCIHIANIN